MTNIVACKCHADESDKGRYDMILGRDILIELFLNLKLSDHVIKMDYAPFKGSTALLVDFGT